MPTATLTSKGQVTIPRPIRQALKLSAGDRLDFVLEAAGRVVLRPAIRDVGELKGLLRRASRKPVSLEAMNAAILRHSRKAR
jgi:AbrB family looped-hinge helix DNA binding protein